MCCSFKEATFCANDAEVDDLPSFVYPRRSTYFTQLQGGYRGPNKLIPVNPPMISYHHLTLSALQFTVASKLAISTTETGIASPDALQYLVIQRCCFLSSEPGLTSCGKSAIVIRDKPWGQRSVPFLDVVWADRPTQLGWIRVATDSQLEVPAKKKDATSDYPSSDQEIRQGSALTLSLGLSGGRLRLIWMDLETGVERCRIATRF